jgi:glycerol-3-phosphate acyltransferase PlsY
MSPRRYLVAAGCGYVAGLLPSAELISRQADPRRAGSGNPGAANVTRLVGKRAGATVFGLDMGKAVVAGYVGRLVAGAAGANIASSAAVIGHCFPATRGFDGGKGVAASFGQMLSTFPAYLPVDLALGAVAAKSDFWRQRPVATIGATCALWTGLAGIWVVRDLPNMWGPPASTSMPIAAGVSSAAIISRFVRAGSPVDPAPPVEPAT